ncbi:MULTISPECIES: site-specific integrase [Delftia]|uniref:Site-specific recombinase XerD n=1 Tax=Delftia lacustris TaxID=558537 RepID=A0A1H3TB16_9BURK|nr:site-specific integrase [Delftia lacustris]SDZ47404.1 Site-specific recombinase XerD [Delftia lacustris]
MPIVKLSAQFVREAVCPPGKSKVDYYDNALKGFILEARPSGGKTFYLRYHDSHGKLRQCKIGDAAAVSYDKARQKAMRLRSEVELGGNPLEERQALRAVPTLAEFIRDTYVPHIHLHRRNFQSTLSFIKCHVLPRFGAKHLDEITTNMLAEAHQDLRTKGYALAHANKIPILFKIMFNLARKKGIPGSESNPADGVVLFNPNNAKERYLSAAETQRLHEVLSRCGSPQLKSIVALLLLLGCRKRELLDARWEDVDLERRNWRIPLTKSGKARSIPISDRALEVLRGLPRWSGCPYVIPNPDTKRPFGNLFYLWDKVRKEAGIADLRMHDLRHTFASNLVNSGQSIYVVSKLLGHSQIKTTARYSHLADETLMSAVDAAAKVVDTSWRPSA